jgi:hypothetical protein
VAAVSRRLLISLLLALASLAVVAASASASLVGFRAPSGNIGCYMNGHFARCDIREHSWQPPPQPASCDLDWGGGLAVDRHGAADFVCAGDTANDPSNPVLEYGDKIKRGRFKCKSKQSGMKCVNTRNGHGFKLSRDEADVF